ncbi:hypothetical protein F5884DRAFT_890496 [Xylogone sp. PMI_703]|nr:hypothetical protein F5884DRAFT_890496 [Xylogone sp. PMI_703]
MARKHTRKNQRGGGTLKESDRRRRQIFRKRGPNVIKKVVELIVLTGCRAAVVIEDLNGNCHSARSSGNSAWSSYIDKIIERYPSGKHQHIPSFSPSSNNQKLSDNDQDGEGAGRQTTPDSYPVSAVQLADSPIASSLENCTAKQPENFSPNNLQVDMESSNGEQSELREATVSPYQLVRPEVGKTAMEEGDNSIWKRLSGIGEKVLHNPSDAAPDRGEHEQGLSISSMMHFLDDCSVVFRR